MPTLNQGLFFERFWQGDFDFGIVFGRYGGRIQDDWNDYRCRILTLPHMQQDPGDELFAGRTNRQRREFEIVSEAPFLQAEPVLIPLSADHEKYILFFQANRIPDEEIYQYINHFIDALDWATDCGAKRFLCTFAVSLHFNTITTDEVAALLKWISNLFEIKKKIHIELIALENIFIQNEDL